MIADAFDDLLAAVDDVKDTVGQAGLLEQLGHPLARERHELGRLHDHRVAEHKSVRHRPIRHHQREIERHDRRDHAERKMIGAAFDAA